MKLYKRELYLRQIRPFYHHPELIKVITGVRRSGKSCLMEMIADELREEGLKESNIIRLNLDRRPYKSIRTPERLEALIDPLLAKAGDGLVYLFIDEIQNVEHFEPLLEGYRLEEDISIFITGSNSYLLSGELATKLTGRCLEFEMMPLNFEEYIGMKRLYGKEMAETRDEEFVSYLKEGGFPGAVLLDRYEDKMAYVSNLVSEIVRKDVKARLKIRNMDAFGAVYDFVVGNFGAPTSRASLHRAFKERFHSPLKAQTIDRYVQALLDAKIIYECKRFDTKSKMAMEGERKYYLADLSFCYAARANASIDYGPALENVVYQFHKGLGDKISIGKVGNLECDFIVRGGPSSYRYIQVAMTIHGEDSNQPPNKKKTVADREYEPLERIRDNYPKYVLTLDRFTQDREGIRNINLLDYIHKEMNNHENGI